MLYYHEGLKGMLSGSIPWLWLPIVKSSLNVSKWINANIPEEDQEVQYLPWGWGQPNNHSKQNCVAVR